MSMHKKDKHKNIFENRKAGNARPAIAAVRKAQLFRAKVFGRALKQCIHIITVSGLIALFAGCGETAPEEADAATTTEARSSLESIELLDTRPFGAIPVQAAREQLKPGDEAIVHGQIGGMENPFLDGYAGFVLTDTDVMFCDEMADEHCPTPWDACCEDPDKLKQSRASVQLVDAGGEILSGSVQGFAGLSGLSHVVVKGTVAPGSTPENLILHARSIYNEE
jgi:hypothetical protein